MPELPGRPDLGQLRRQARELLRDARSGEPGAAARLRAVSDQLTLSAAQLAVARGYGHRSWTALKAEVGTRLAGQPYFVALLPEEAGRAASGISVRDARTGDVTDRLKPPAGEHFSGVTAAGPGAYLVSACARQASRPERRSPPWDYRLYRLQVDAAGRAGLTPVPGGLLPPGQPDLAVSRDGTVLAYTVRHIPELPTADPAGGLRIYRTDPARRETGLADLSTGERRAVPLPPGDVRELSLASDGQTLAFLWHPRPAPGDVDVYVAPAAADDWVAAGKPLTGPSGQPYDASSPVISADGRSVYVTVTAPEPAGGPHWNRLLEVPAGGGEARTLFELRYQPHHGNLVSMWGPVCRNRAGDQLLAFARGYAYRIDISAGAVTRLPFPEGQAVDAAW